MSRGRVLGLVVGAFFSTACGAGFISPGCLSNVPPDVPGKGLACNATSESGAPRGPMAVAVSTDARTFAAGTAFNAHVNAVFTNQSGVDCLVGGRCPPFTLNIDRADGYQLWPYTDQLPDCTGSPVVLQPGESHRYSFAVTGLRLDAGVYYVTGYSGGGSHSPTSGGGAAYGRFFFAVC